MADALKLWWAWRKKTDRPFLRSILLILVALLFIVATVAASIFTSFVADAGEIDVLVQSPFCGRVNSNADNGQTYAITEIDQLSPQYTYSCYRNGSLPSTCNKFVRPNIPLHTTDAPCPFSNGTFCDTKEAFVVDSGLLDVGTNFGLNLAAKDRVQYRKRSTCTVLPAAGYYDIFDLRNDSSLRSAVEAPLKEDQLAITYWGTTFQQPIWASYIMSMTMSMTSGRPAVRA
tara:strand:- start:2053 stop:2742 length:690 start_codon:yes stop_codon:yes gene_type:complete